MPPTTTLTPPPLESIIDTVKIRAMRASDLGFVIKAWLKTYRYSGTAVIFMTAGEYYDTYEPVVKSLISRSEVYIACLREDEDVNLGFLAIERRSDKDLIHFISVKKVWQKNGVGRYLLHASQPQKPTYFTHWTAPCHQLSLKYPNFIFNPFLVFMEDTVDGKGINENRHQSA